MVQRDYEKLFMNLLRLAPRLASHFAMQQAITMGRQLRMDKSLKLSSIHRMDKNSGAGDFRHDLLLFGYPRSHTSAQGRVLLE